MQVSSLIIPGLSYVSRAMALNTQEWNITANIILADPIFHRSNPIDMMLNMEVTISSVKKVQYESGPDLHVLQKTVFEWVISGQGYFFFFNIKFCLLTKSNKSNYIIIIYTTLSISNSSVPTSITLLFSIIKMT